MKETKAMTKLTPAQAYALQVKSDRRAAAADRCNSIISADEARIKRMFTVEVDRKPAKAKRANSKKVRWIGAEFDLLINLYLKHVDVVGPCDNRDAIADEFALQFPERGHSAVCLAVMQVKGLDALYPAEGLKDTSQELVDKLFAVDPIRFPGGASKEEKIFNALDVLLANIREN